MFFPIGDYRVSNTMNIPTGATPPGASGGFGVYATIGRSRIFIDPWTLRNASASATYHANITL